MITTITEIDAGERKDVDVSNIDAELEAAEAKLVKLTEAASNLESASLEARARFEREPNEKSYLASVVLAQKATNARAAQVTFERSDLSKLRGRFERVRQLRDTEERVAAWNQRPSETRGAGDDMPKPERPLSQLELDAEQRLNAQGRSLWGAGAR